MKKLKKPGDLMSLAALSWLHVLLLCGGIYLLLAGILGMPSAAAARYLLGSLWLIVPVTASWAFIRCIRSFLLYLLCSAAVTLLIGHLSSCALTGALCGALFLLRGYVRIKKGRITRAMREMTGDTAAQISKELWEIPTFLDEPHPAHWVFFCVCYLGVLPTRRYFLLRWIFFLLIAEVFVCFLYRYLARMWRFIRENRRIANLPVGAIQKVSRVLLPLAAAVLLLAVLPSVLYGKEPLADVIENFHPKPLNASEWEELFPAGAGMFGDMDLDGLAPEAPNPPAWLSLLSDILVYFFAVAAVIAVFLIVYRMCRNAAQYFAQEEDDEIVFLSEDAKHAALQSESAPRERRERWGSPNRRIRRFYKKTLRSRLKASPSGWESPQELEHMAALEDERRAVLHRLYEKARYSREGCRADEAEKIARLYK